MKGAVSKESAGELGREGGEGRSGGAAVDGDDTGLAGGVVEGLVVGTGDYVAAVAAH